jgi:hypothetical protein
MKLSDIRERVGYDPAQPQSVKDATRAMLCGRSAQYPYALTLTLKQTLAISTAVGVADRTLRRDDCVRIAKRFQQKLNRQVFGKRAAEMHGKSLRYLVVLEGERSNKHLHLHLAIGGMPRYVKPSLVPAYVSAAKQLVTEIDTQYKLDIADSGWLEYMSKEATRNNCDNVLWELCN